MADDDDLETELRRLRSEVHSLQRRVSELEASDGDGSPSVSDAETGSPAPNSNRRRKRTDSSVDQNGTASSSSEDQTPSSEEQVGGKTRQDDWERDVGIKWLGLVGGVALLAGVVFFIRLAIDAGLLGPLGRVAVGTVGGLALFGAGRLAAERQGHYRWGRLTAGIGLATSYFSLYAAYGFETYRTALGTPLWAVVLALSVLVAAAAAVSVRDRSPIVAGETFLLGYVTAYLGLESATFLLTPAYAVVLAGGLVAIATVRPWSRLVITSVLPTYGIVWLWSVDANPQDPIVAGVIIVTFALYLAGGYVLREWNLSNRWFPIQIGSLTVLNAVLAAYLLEVTARGWSPDGSADGLALAAVALALTGFYAVTSRQPVRRDDTAGALSVVLIAGSIVLAAGPFVTTVGLLVVVCGAIAVAWIVDAAAIRTGVHFVAAVTAYKLLVVDSTELSAFDLTDPLATATGRATAFVLAIAVFYGLAWCLRERTETPPGFDDNFPVASAYAVVGTGLVTALLWLELSGLGVSVAWAVFGLALVGIGLVADTRLLRYQGIGVLGLATVKVFLYDTQDLDTLARTLSFLVLGAILLAASYAYAHWKGEEPLARFTGE